MRRASWIVRFLLISCLGATPAAAQDLFEQALEEADEEEPAESGGSTSTGTTLEWGGFLRGSVFAGKVPDRDHAELKSGYGEAALKLRARTGSLGDGFAEMRFRGGTVSGAGETSVDLREAYVNLWLGPLDLRFGRQIVVWGRADAYNPTDNVTPRDMAVRSAVEDDRRRANLALRTTWNVHPCRLELIWVPLFAPTRLPDFSLPGPITFAEPDYPDAGLDNGTGAARLHVETSAFEGSVSYLIGTSTVPGVVLDGFVLEGGSPGPRVRFTSYRHHVVGFDFAVPVSDWFGLRGEAAWRQVFGYTNDRWKPRPDVQAVVGFDREVSDFMIVVQYVFRHVLDPDEPPHGTLDLETAAEKIPAGLTEVPAAIQSIVADEIAWKNRVIAGQTHDQSHQLLGRVEWKLLYETLSLALLGSVNVVTEEWFVRPTLVYQVDDALAVTAGAEVYGGPDETLFGMIDETMSAGFVELKASF